VVLFKENDLPIVVGQCQFKVEDLSMYRKESRIAVGAWMAEDTTQEGGRKKGRTEGVKKGQRRHTKRMGVVGNTVAG
jgi:hypothetical protein